jgi:hypothetical protein
MRRELTQKSIYADNIQYSIKASNFIFEFKKNYFLVFFIIFKKLFL